MGELHLDIIVDRMKREFNVEANIGKPQVAYRETITGEAEAEYKYIRQTGGRGQYGHVKIRVKPMPLEEEKIKNLQEILRGLKDLNSSTILKEVLFHRNIFQQLRKEFVRRWIEVFKLVIKL